MVFWRGPHEFQIFISGVYSISDKYFLAKNTELHWHFSEGKFWCTTVSQLIYVCTTILKFPKWADRPRSGGCESHWEWRGTEHIAIVQNSTKSSNSTETEVSCKKNMWLKKRWHMVAINHWALQSRDTKQKKKGKLNALQDVTNEK